MSLTRIMPSLSRTARDREASTKPYVGVRFAFVATARFSGGQHFVSFKVDADTLPELVPAQAR